MRDIFTIPHEPRGSAYVELVDASLGYADSLLLVTRHSIDIGPPALETLERLRPFTIGQREATEWPGTQLLENTATVYTVRLLPEVAAIMTETATGLFDWTQPWLPEDPCLLRPDGSPWLVTISHEKDSYVNLSGEEREALLAGAPNLASTLGPPDEHGETVKTVEEAAPLWPPSHPVKTGC